MFTHSTFRLLKHFVSKGNKTQFSQFCFSFVEIAERSCSLLLVCDHKNLLFFFYKTMVTPVSKTQSKFGGGVGAPPRVELRSGDFGDDHSRAHTHTHTVEASGSNQRNAKAAIRVKASQSLVLRAQRLVE